jgi:POT family proton-dependent oligopeptide transporter
VYIVGNEAAERFSYYGMKCILVVFMTRYLTLRSGEPAPLDEASATFWYHSFNFFNYLLPIIGAVLADCVWGKYKTIVLLSMVYCGGHLVLALDSTRLGLVTGLSLIALGAGGIKPCVSAHLGDQYRSGSETLRSAAFSYFYMAINVGAAISTLLIPAVLERYGPHTAFAIPGVLMLVATGVFVAGRPHFIVVPPTPFMSYVTQLREPVNRKLLLQSGLVFALLSIFWSLFDQTGSSWVLQAEKMQSTISVPLVGEVTVLASQIQALNPIFILVLTPVFAWWVYPFFARRASATPLDRMAVGLVLAAVSFGIVGLAQVWLDSGKPVSVAWQALAYVVLTSSEVLVSVTSLEFAYTHGPRVSRSFGMSFYLLSVALGNAVTAVCARIVPSVAGSTAGFFFFFSGLAILCSASLFALRRKGMVDPSVH